MTTRGAEIADARSWQAAIAAGVLEIATCALGFTTSEVSAAVAMDATGLIGAHLPLLGGPHALEIALVGTPDNCRAIAAAMLQTTPESLSMADIADAVGETLNMLGGIVKRRVGNELEIGLPIFMIGHIQTTERISVTVVPAKFGAIQMYVQVIGRRS